MVWLAAPSRYVLRSEPPCSWPTSSLVAGVRVPHARQPDSAPAYVLPVRRRLLARGRPARPADRTAGAGVLGGGLGVPGRVCSATTRYDWTSALSQRGLRRARRGRRRARPR
ncbi:hypothetical protein [Nonomuraea dietziae]|uniref:hypothetical protein n=1 Tax=Nonomuraea dietziae TaxID=65515 RepID=UPI0031E38E75